MIWHIMIFETHAGSYNKRREATGVFYFGLVLHLSVLLVWRSAFWIFTARNTPNVPAALSARPLTLFMCLAMLAVAVWLRGPPVSASRSPSLLQTNITWQILAGLPWNAADICDPRGRLLMTSWSWGLWLHVWSQISPDSNDPLTLKDWYWTTH